jgi:hypothetical protein
MNTTRSTQSQVETRRDKIKTLAFKGKTRKEISKDLGVSYATVTTDLKILGIIPATNYNLKENA